MKRNIFGQPVPGTADELDVALDEVMENHDDLRAMVDHNTEEGDFNGWTAEIDDGEGNTISTKGYETREALVSDLKAVGINDIDDY